MLGDDEIRATFVKNLKRIMYNRGKRQADLVNDLHLSSSTVSEWLTGKKYPRVDKIQMLADYLGCTMADFIGEQKAQAAEVNIKRSTVLDIRLLNFNEELALRKSEFSFEGYKLDTDDVDLLRAMISSFVDIYRNSLRNKYRR